MANRIEGKKLAQMARRKQQMNLFRKRAAQQRQVPDRETKSVDLKVGVTAHKNGIRRSSPRKMQIRYVWCPDGAPVLLHDMKKHLGLVPLNLHSIPWPVDPFPQIPECSDGTLIIPPDQFTPGSVTQYMRPLLSSSNEKDRKLVINLRKAFHPDKWSRHESCPGLYDGPTAITIISQGIGEAHQAQQVSESTANHTPHVSSSSAREAFLTPLRGKTDIKGGSNGVDHLQSLNSRGQRNAGDHDILLRLGRNLTSFHHARKEPEYPRTFGRH
ncbi:hypothetical protein B0H14DRAFT_2575182 [Mycena olivaceomarginata]|nr:hypothetical protein B0H14DRAFT_2575182 [Mycena olivaceomarginata]